MDGSPPKPWEKGASGDFKSLHSSAVKNQEKNEDASKTTPPQNSSQQFSRPPHASAYNSPYHRLNSGYGSYGTTPYGSSMFGMNNYRSPYTSAYNHQAYGVTSPYDQPYNSAYGAGPMGYMNQETSGYSYAIANVENSFNNIYRIVQAVGSVQFLMGTTLDTVQNCFRAGISVIDHFSELRESFINSSFLRFVIRLWRKFVNLILRRNNLEDVWANGIASNSTAAAGQEALSLSGGGLAWPLVIFLSVVFGLPLFLSRGSKRKESLKVQRKGKVHKAYFKEHDSDVTVLEDDIVDIVKVSKNNEWLGVKVQNTSKNGWIPRSCVTMLPNTDLEENPRQKSLSRSVVPSSGSSKAPHSD